VHLFGFDEIYLQQYLFCLALQEASLFNVELALEFIRKVKKVKSLKNGAQRWR